MKVLLTIVIFLGTSAGYIYHLWINAPSSFYQKIISARLATKWYITDELNPRLLVPRKKDDQAKADVPNQDLWQSFHFEDLFIPLPVRNPFFFVVPNLQYDQEKKRTKFGLTIVNSKEEVISHIFFLPHSRFPEVMSSQELFELPLLRNYLKKKSENEIWKDAFTLDLSRANNSWQEMSYYLYLIQFRLKLLGKDFKRFGLLGKREKAYVDLPYANKDFKAELFLEKQGRSIYSFIVVSLKNSEQAQMVRRKMIDDVQRENTSLALTDIIFKEFKSLSYTDQIDHLGMFYLLSSWSHDQSRQSIIEQMIFHLERGELNQLQLAPLYTYYYRRYGEVFSKKFVKGVKLDADLSLKMKVLNEESREKAADLKLSEREPHDSKETISGQFDKIIEKTKLKSDRQSKTIRID